MKRIPTIVLIIVVIACLAFGLNEHKPLSSTTETAKKPNIVFILVDDLGVTDVGYSGSEFYETPHIDKLASQGVVFSQAYANSAVCSPSRASIMTGQFTARHKVTDWIGANSGAKWTKQHNTVLSPPDYLRALPKANQTLAETMRSNGYQTFFAGKWHIGSTGNLPTDHGFDINKGGWQKGRPVGGYFAPWKNPELENGPAGENLSMHLAEETVDFISQNKDKPFFAFLSFYAVHAPIQTTQEKWQKYRDKAATRGLADYGFEMEAHLPIRVVQDNPVYAGLVESMDDAVGKVLDALASNGLADNTIVVFTSDHGGVASGDAYATSNLPYRGGKGYQWEGGLRVPMIITAPGISETKSIETSATGADLYPTILDLAGLELLPNQHADGKSLKPLLEGKSISDRPLYWHYPHYGNQGGDPTSIVQEGNLKLIYYWEDGHSELYNFKADIGEQNDLAQTDPVTTSRLEAQLIQWLEDVGANTPTLNPAFDAKKAEQLRLRYQNTTMPQLEQKRKHVLSPTYNPDPMWWGSERLVHE